MRLAMRNGAPAETIVLGTGVEDSPGEVSFARAIKRADAFPLVITADALSATGEALEELARRSGWTKSHQGRDTEAWRPGQRRAEVTASTARAVRRSRGPGRGAMIY